MTHTHWGVAVHLVRAAVAILRRSSFVHWSVLKTFSVGWWIVLEIITSVRNARRVVSSRACRNPTCIAENVNKEGWCPVHAAHPRLREVSLVGKFRCIECGEPLTLDATDDGRFCSEGCRQADAIFWK